MWCLIVWFALSILSVTKYISSYRHLWNTYFHSIAYVDILRVLWITYILVTLYDLSRTCTSVCGYTDLLKVLQTIASIFVSVISLFAFRNTSRLHEWVQNYLHYTDVIMGANASQITSLTIVNSGADQRNITAPRHWPLWGEFTGDRWIPRTNGQLRGKFFPLMTSACRLSRWCKCL